MAPTKFVAYTTRRMSSDVLARLRILASVRSAEAGERVTMEQVLNEVLMRGLPLVEQDVLAPQAPRAKKA